MRASSVLALAAVGACPAAKTGVAAVQPEQEGTEPTIESVAVVPAEVAVALNQGASTTFPLGAVVLDSEGDPVTTLDDPLVWEASNTWVTFSDEAGLGVTVNITNPLTVEHVVTVTATAATAGTVTSDPATITITPETVPPDDDKIVAPFTGGKPDVALIDGLRVDESSVVDCVNDEVAVLVGSVEVANFDSGCGDGGSGTVALFSQKHAAINQSVSWSSGTDVIDLTPVQQEPLILEVTMWKAGAEPQDGLSVEQIMGIDRDLAQLLLATNRVGVKLEIEIVEEAIAGVAAEYSCNCDDDQAGCTSVDDIEKVAAGVLNVYYVKSIGGPSGIYCTRGLGRGEDKIMLADTHPSTSVVHEIGHALGLVWPGRMGHANAFGDLGDDNIMTSTSDDTKAEARDKLSLGQVFRMNYDAYSWLHQFATTTPTFPCQCEEFISVPCPRLGMGITTPVDQPATNDWKWRCADELLLHGTDEFHGGVAMVHGHNVRQPPGTCSWFAGLPARMSKFQRPKHISSETLRLWLPNQQWDPECSWWLAVFFDRQRMWLRTLPAEKEFGYLALDYVEYDDVPESQLELPVHLWFDGGESEEDVDDTAAPGTFDYPVAMDVEHASEGFSAILPDGRRNRTGIRLQWHRPESDAPFASDPAELKALMVEISDATNADTRNDCPSGTSNPYAISGQINVYYVGKTDLAPLFSGFEPGGGDWCEGPDGTQYVILAPNLDAPTWPYASPLDYSSTALTHGLGHALGLDDVSGIDGMKRHNVMWGNPWPADVGLRRTFSLGQAFRMNLDPKVWSLRGVSLPTIDCSAGQCPPLDASYEGGLVTDSGGSD